MEGYKLEPLSEFINSVRGLEIIVDEKTLEKSMSIDRFLENRDVEFYRINGDTFSLILKLDSDDLKGLIEKYYKMTSGGLLIPVPED